MFSAVQDVKLQCKLDHLLLGLSNSTRSPAFQRSSIISRDCQHLCAESDNILLNGSFFSFSSDDYS